MPTACHQSSCATATKRYLLNIVNSHCCSCCRHRCHPEDFTVALLRRCVHHHALRHQPPFPHAAAAVLQRHRADAHSSRSSE